MNYHLDYETRSLADLGECGAYRYAEDPTTDILLAAIASGEEGPFIWVNPKFETPQFKSHPMAFVLIQRAFEEPDSLIYAWNAQFERAITMFQCARAFGLQPPRATQWRCTAAMARKAALRGSLELAGQDLGLPFQKDPAGRKLIQLFSMPQKDGALTDPILHPQEFLQFGGYCLDDVRTEISAHAALKPFELQRISLDTFQLDVTLNDRGVPVNLAACVTARGIVDEFMVERTTEFEKATGLRPSQRQRVKELLATLGLEVPDMKQPTLESACGQATDPKVLEVLQGYMELNYAAAKKVHSILNCANADGRVRGTLLYHGASTGRWAGRLIQPQNFKKPTIKNTDLAYKMICEGATRQELQTVFGNPLETVASCIRHFIQDPEGLILDADYAQIECRIVCWLAGQHDALQAFASGEDQYIRMAAKIYGVDPASLKNPSRERDLGKQAVLGCGFQMWWPKFQTTCAKYKIVVDDDLAERAVRTYREEFTEVVQLWYDVDRAARNAITCPGKIFAVGRLAFVTRKVAGILFLCLTLPSGRVIVYPHPRVEITEKDIAKAEERTRERVEKHAAQGRAGLVAPEEPKPSITFYGQIKDNVWGRVSTYGGKLVENATQATAADIMSHGMQNAERAGFEGLTLIHDQALARPRDRRDMKKELADYVAALKHPPAWALGCPIDADGKIVPYYKK